MRENTNDDLEAIADIYSGKVYQNHNIVVCKKEILFEIFKESSMIKELSDLD